MKRLDKFIQLTQKGFRLFLGNQSIVISNCASSLASFPIQYLRALGMDIKKVLHHMLKTYRRTNQAVLKVITDQSPPILLDNKAKHALQHSDFSEDKIKITFLAAARRKNNPNCKLDGFLKSVVDQAANIQQIEVLLAVDPDDQLNYFIELKEKYQSKIRFRIFITEKRLGYENLHLYDAFLFPHIAKNTRMICDYSDDCRVIMPNFDIKLLEIDASYPDNIYFIHTRESNRESYVGDVAKNIELLYWVMQVKEPASYFPIYSRKVLEIASDYAALHDIKHEWSPIANSWICDCYIDILSNKIKALGSDRIHIINMIEMNRTILASYQHADKQTTLSPNNRAFIKMLNSQTLNYLSGLSMVIHQQVENFQSECKEAMT